MYKIYVEIGNYKIGLKDTDIKEPANDNSILNTRIAQMTRELLGK